MAQKQTDPTLRTASIIANRMGDTALTYRNKAPNDKTYSATILGVNRKFTDDVTEDDITNKLAKFNIPETVGEGENNYYTFKINGEYYCKQQTGNFKLYDKIMVYIPNGDWSNMYFDYPDASSHGGSGGGGSNSGDGHQFIVSVDAPGGNDPQLGDMWLFVRDETRTTFSELEPSDYAGMYTWQIDEDTQVQSWKYTTCTVSESAPSSGNKVGNLWIKLQNDHFNKIYLCTSTEGTTVWSEIYPDDETGMGYNLFISADRPVSEGDYWIKIDDEATSNIVMCSQYKFNSSTNQFEWILMFNAAGGSVTIGNGLEYDSQGRLQAKLGEGLTFDSNGAITMAYNPVINIAHALVYKKESQE